MPQTAALQMLIGRRTPLAEPWSLDRVKT